MAEEIEDLPSEIVTGILDGLRAIEEDEEMGSEKEIERRVSSGQRGFDLSQKKQRGSSRD